jgi:DNA-binding transcriptional LysR family regulator
MQNVDINRFSYFVAIVEAGSLTDAADRLEVNKAVVSHQLAKLEAELGTTLIVRNTRNIRVTKIGQEFYSRCKLILNEVDEAVAHLSFDSETPNGTLALTAPMAYGACIVTDAVAKYLVKYPQMTVDMIYEDKTIDTISSDLDLAVRVGWLQDTSERARRIGQFDQILVCSPEFAARSRQIEIPAQLERHGWISNGALRDPLRWTLMLNDDKVVINGSATIKANSTAGTYACALAGIGLAVLPDFIVARDLQTGQLVQVLPDWSIGTGDINVIYPPSRFRPAKVDAFVKVLIEHISVERLCGQVLNVVGGRQSPGN